MNYKAILKKQKQLGLTEMQDLINSGTVWKMEGSMGRAAMDLIRSGACMLPKKRYCDYYGNTIPSRLDLKKGSPGTFQNSVEFHSNHY